MWHLDKWHKPPPQTPQMGYIKEVEGKGNQPHHHTTHSISFFTMATRSRIGIQLGDSVLSVYHHWDGYPEWLGKQLVEHYNSKEKASELIDGGDMSVCLDDDGNTNPSYYSQRGEDCPPRYDESLNEYLSEGEEFAYLYTSAGWVCYDRHEYTPQDPEVVAIPAS